MSCQKPSGYLGLLLRTNINSLRPFQTHAQLRGRSAFEKGMPETAPRCQQDNVQERLLQVTARRLA